MASDLLDQIDLAKEIDAEGRRDDIPPIGRRRHCQSQSSQDALDLGVRYRKAEQRREARASKVQQRRVARHRIAIDEGADQLARADLLHQGDRPLKGQNRNADVGAALEPG